MGAGVGLIRPVLEDEVAVKQPSPEDDRAERWVEPEPEPDPIAPKRKKAAVSPAKKRTSGNAAKPLRPTPVAERRAPEPPPPAPAKKSNTLELFNDTK